MLDGISVIHRAFRFRNVVHTFGDGHQGLIGGAVKGKLISEMAADLSTSVDLKPIRVNRL